MNNNATGYTSGRDLLKGNSVSEYGITDDRYIAMEVISKKEAKSETDYGTLTLDKDRDRKQENETPVVATNTDSEYQIMDESSFIQVHTNTEDNSYLDSSAMKDIKNSKN